MRRKARVNLAEIIFGQFNPIRALPFDTTRSQRNYRRRIITLRSPENGAPVHAAIVWRSALEHLLESGALEQISARFAFGTT